MTLKQTRPAQITQDTPDTIHRTQLPGSSQPASFLKCTDANTTACLWRSCSVRLAQWKSHQSEWLKHIETPNNGRCCRDAIICLIPRQVSPAVAMSPVSWHCGAPNSIKSSISECSNVLSCSYCCCLLQSQAPVAKNVTLHNHTNRLPCQAHLNVFFVQLKDLDTRIDCGWHQSNFIFSTLICFWKHEQDRHKYTVKLAQHHTSIQVRHTHTQVHTSPCKWRCWSAIIRC